MVCVNWSGQSNYKKEKKSEKKRKKYVIEGHAPGVEPATFKEESTALSTELQTLFRILKVNSYPSIILTIPIRVIEGHAPGFEPTTFKEESTTLSTELHVFFRILKVNSYPSIILTISIYNASESR